MAARLGSNKLNLLRRDRHDPRKTFRYFNDFFSLPVDDTTAHVLDWGFQEDSVAAIVSISDKRGGWLRLETDGDDNDEVNISSSGQAFIFNTTDELMFECEVQSTLVGDAQYGFVMGLSDTVGANTLVNDTMAIVSSFDGALFHYLPAADIAFTTSNAATQVQTAAAYTYTNADLIRLGFFYDPNDGVTAKVIPVVNGVEGTAHDLTISGLEEMNILFGAKTGSANAQIVEWDWVEVIQRRNAATDIGTPYG
jgi:hypothetical protein